MNETASYLILGLVQGLTEFLPVSSSGHLLLLEKTGIGEENLLFDLLMHLSTLLVVLIVYRKKILWLIKNPRSKKNIFLLVASLPTALCAGAIRFFIPNTSMYLPLCFFITSILLLLPSLIEKKGKDFPSLVKAIFVGLAQGGACFAGVSRSGTTATALLLVGCPADECAEYSFLLSIPIILGSSAVELLFGSSSHALTWNAIPAFVVAFVSGYFSLRVFSTVLQKGKMKYFSIYTLALSVVSFHLLF